MPSHIQLVADQVLPEPPLPNSGLTTLEPRTVTLARPTASRQITASEQALDGTPPRRIVAVTIRQYPNAMQVLGQETHRNDNERHLPLNVFHDLAQARVRHWLSEEGAPVMSDNGKEESTARTGCSTVVGHY
jgi:hypothetical protein